MSCSLPNFRLLLSPFGFSLFNSFCFCLSLLNLLYPLGEFAYGNPRTEKAFEIEHHIVNGFDVFLVDNRYGNEVTLAVHVPTGSYHDDPLLHAGRAHLWEHVIHNGSKGFPGSNTFHNLSSRMGARTNAFTSENRTFYYLSFHPDALKEAAQLQGDMFSQPEWKEDAFQKEKLNVMDEAKQYQSYSARILQSSIWLNLLPAGHPWSMYNVGTQVQLEKMRLADLQELYFSSYVPRSMSIIVAGNFTESADGKELLSKEKVLEFIRTYYHPPSVPDSFKSLVAGKDIVFPDISDGMGPKFIELGSSKQNEHLLLLNFQIPTDFASQNFIAIETMNDYLNSNGPGSLSDHLKSQGLLVSTGAHFSKTNNIWREFLWLELTPKGAENRYRVVEQIFSYLASLSKNGISQEYLEFLIKRNIFSYQEQLRNPVEATKLLGQFSEMVPNPTEAFNFANQYRKVSSEKIQEALKLCFRIDHLLGGYLGSEVISNQKAAVFEVPIIKPEENPLSESWLLAYEKGHDLLPKQATQIILAEVPLQYSDTPLSGPSRKARRISFGNAGILAGLAENHNETFGSIALNLLTSQLKNAQQLASIQLYFHAFREHFKQELSYLDSLGFIGAHGPTQIVVKGNSIATQEALVWLIDNYFTFIPNQKEIEIAKTKLNAELLESQDKFPAQTSLADLKTYLNRSGFSLDSLVLAARPLSAQRVLRLARPYLKRTDIVLAMSGDYSEGNLIKLIQHLEDKLPQRLSVSERAQVNRLNRNITRTHRIFRPLAENQSDTSFGIARTYLGPDQRDPDKIPMSVLTHELYDQVFQLNRTERGLGYVHSAGLYETIGDTHPFFIGQADGKTLDEAILNLQRTREGWEELLEMIRQGTLSANEFEDTKKAILRKRSLIPYRIEALALRMVSSLVTQHRADGFELDTQKIAQTRGQEVYRAGRKYLLEKPYVEMINSRRPCAQTLVNLGIFKE